MGVEENNKLTLALQLISRGQYTEGEQRIRELITIGWNLPECFYALGVIRLGLGQLGPAIEQFDHCVNLNPNHANAFYYLGDIYERLHDTAKAEGFYRKAVQINPNHSSALARLAALSRAQQAGGMITPSQEAAISPLASASPSYQGAAQAAPAFQSPQPVSMSSDFYGLLRSSIEPVEQEISRHLDSIAARIGRRRARARAFVGLAPLMFLSLVCAVLSIVIQGQALGRMRNPLPAFLALFITLFVPLFLVVLFLLWLRATNSKLSCERDWLVRSKGVLSKSTDNLHLFLLSRGPVSYSQTLMNRITGDGTLQLGTLSLRGYFRRSELEELASHFRQLSLLNPTSRNILAALGELKQIRSGAN